MSERSAPLPLRTIGLTGGIGSGKSTVAASLRERGFPVLDADAIARDVVAPGTPGLEQVLSRFGEELRRGDGTLDRVALGARVFGDPAKRAELEAILHPRIAAETTARMASLEAQGAPAIFYDAALLFEAGADERVDEVVVVVAPVARQSARTMARDGCSEARVRARMEAQLSSEEREARADHLLDNTGDRDSLERGIDALLGTLELPLRSAA